jgi:hypothetical protein
MRLGWQRAIDRFNIRLITSMKSFENNRASDQLAALYPVVPKIPGSPHSGQKHDWNVANNSYSTNARGHSRTAPVVLDDRSLP